MSPVPGSGSPPPTAESHGMMPPPPPGMHSGQLAAFMRRYDGSDTDGQVIQRASSAPPVHSGDLLDDAALYDQFAHMNLGLDLEDSLDPTDPLMASLHPPPHRYGTPPPPSMSATATGHSSARGFPHLTSGLASTPGPGPLYHHQLPHHHLQHQHQHQHLYAPYASSSLMADDRALASMAAAGRFSSMPEMDATSFSGPSMFAMPPPSGGSVSNGTGGSAAAATTAHAAQVQRLLHEHYKQQEQQQLQQQQQLLQQQHQAGGTSSLPPYMSVSKPFLSAATLSLPGSGTATPTGPPSGSISRGMELFGNSPIVRPHSAQPAPSLGLASEPSSPISAVGPSPLPRESAAPGSGNPWRSRSPVSALVGLGHSSPLPPPPPPQPSSSSHVADMIQQPRPAPAHASGLQPLGFATSVASLTPQSNPRVLLGHADGTGSQQQQQQQLHMPDFRSPSPSAVLRHRLAQAKAQAELAAATGYSALSGGGPNGGGMIARSDSPSGSGPTASTIDDDEGASLLLRGLLTPSVRERELTMGGGASQPHDPTAGLSVDTIQRAYSPHVGPSHMFDHGLGFDRGQHAFAAVPGLSRSSSVPPLFHDEFGMGGPRGTGVLSYGGPAAVPGGGVHPQHHAWQQQQQQQQRHQTYVMDDYEVYEKMVTMGFRLPSGALPTFDEFLEVVRNPSAFAGAPPPPMHSMQQQQQQQQPPPPPPTAAHDFRGPRAYSGIHSTPGSGRSSPVHGYAPSPTGGVGPQTPAGRKPLHISSARYNSHSVPSSPQMGARDLTGSPMPPMGYPSTSAVPPPPPPAHGGRGSPHPGQQHQALGPYGSGGSGTRTPPAQGLGGGYAGPPPPPPPPQQQQQQQHRNGGGNRGGRRGHRDQRGGGGGYGRDEYGGQYQQQPPHSRRYSEHDDGGPPRYDDGPRGPQHRRGGGDHGYHDAAQQHHEYQHGRGGGSGGGNRSRSNNNNGGGPPPQHMFPPPPPPPPPMVVPSLGPASTTSQGPTLSSTSTATGQVGGRSAMLDEFRASKTRRYELVDVRGSMVEFSSDQHGSRFIQQRLEVATDADKDMVFAEILPASLQLMTDVFGNYVIQKFFEHGSEQHRQVLSTQTMAGHILPLSLQMYGCRVVQKALEHVGAPVQAAIVRELAGHVLMCVKDQNGNHVIQKAIERVTHAPDIQFILDAFHGQLFTLATHPYGCRVVQRIFEHCSAQQVYPLLGELHRYTPSLVADQYGNYVVQHVLEHGPAEDRARVMAHIKGQVLGMSKHKFASNVVEKCVSFGSPAERESLMAEVLAKDASPLLQMMRDQYANYVVQKMLDVVDGDQRIEMLTKVRPYLSSLKRFTYGKHLITKIDRMLVACGLAPGSSSSSSGSANVTAITTAGSSPMGSAPSSPPITTSPRSPRHHQHTGAQMMHFPPPGHSYGPMVVPPPHLPPHSSAEHGHHHGP